MTDHAALLAAWRTSRDPGLADALDRADRDAARPPLPGRTVAERERAWDALFAAYDPADLPRLLAPLLSFGRAVVRRDLRRLAAKGADPRLGAALTGWVVQRPTGYQGRAAADLWVQVLTVLGRTGDVRQLPALEAVYEQVRTRSGCHADDVLRDRLPAVLAALRALPAPTPAPPVPTVDRDALFAAVYADPDDDAPRAVLADLLLAEGDPHGELIALQLRPTRAGAARVRELVGAHWQRLAGPLGPALRKDGLVFHRGFLRRCTLGATPAPVDLDTDAWATIEELRISGGAVPPSAWPKMVSLRRLSGHAGGVLLSPAPVPRLEELVAEEQIPDPMPRWAVLAARLPALRRLSLARLWDAPDPAQWDGAEAWPLEHLQIDRTFFGDLPEWQRWMARAPAAMTVAVTRGLFTLRREAGRWSATPAIVLNDYQPEERVEHCAAQLSGLDVPVALRVRSGVPQTDALGDRALARLPPGSSFELVVG